MERLQTVRSVGLELDSAWLLFERHDDESARKYVRTLLVAEIARAGGLHGHTDLRQRCYLELIAGFHGEYLLGDLLPFWTDVSSHKIKMAGRTPLQADATPG